MRNTLIIALLMCLPTAVLLASASLAVLIGKLRQGPNPPVLGPADGRA